MEFKAEDRKLGDVIFNNDQFRIPRYQRPYAWGEDQVNDYWNDLNGNEKTYFLGGLILNYEHQETENRVDIIDGQQRVLTTTIFFAALRDLCDDIYPELSDAIQNETIAYGSNQILLEGSSESNFRIEVGESTKRYFEMYIQNRNNEILSSKPFSQEEKKIKKVYEVFYTKCQKHLSTFDRDNKISWIRSIIKKIQNLTIIEIKITSEEDAYEIFETTNARGVDLSVSDLIKNVIFKHLPSRDHRDDAKEKWIELSEKIENSGHEIKRFIRYHWLSKHEFVTDRNLFRSIKDKTPAGATSAWESLLTELSVDAENWELLFKGSEDDFSKFKNDVKLFYSIEALRNMRVIQQNVLLLAIFRNYEKLCSNPFKTIEFIERFTYQYSVVCKMPTNKVEKIYSKYAIKLQNAVDEGYQVDKEVQTVFHKLKSELNEIKPSRDVFIESFQSIQYANTQVKRRIVGYTLSKINEFMTTNTEYRVDRRNVNIEHILPQKPNSDWGLTTKEIKSYVNQLGNLTLLSRHINSAIQNNLLSDKVESLKESQLPITIDFIDNLEGNYEWNEDLINARQRKLAEMAFDKVWRL